MNIAGKALGIEIETHMVRGIAEFDAAFAAMASTQVSAVIIQPTLPRARAVELISQHRLPAVSGNRAFADAGGLMSYAASLADRYREAAVYVDKILKGRNPGDLPVQQPTKFELGHQPQDRHGARAHCPAEFAAACRRADQVSDAIRTRILAARDAWTKIRGRLFWNMLRC